MSRRCLPQGVVLDDRPLADPWFHGAAAPQRWRVMLDPVGHPFCRSAVRPG